MNLKKYKMLFFGNNSSPKKKHETLMTIKLVKKNVDIPRKINYSMLLDQKTL